MSELKLNLGVQSFPVGDDFAIAFNPSDLFFIRRFFSAFEAVEDIHTKCYADAEKAKDDYEEFFRVFDEGEKEIRAQIDGIFGDSPVCAHVFHDDAAGDLSVFAAADGLHNWTNLFFWILENIDERFVQEEKAQNPRMKAILAKYEKRRKKK